MSISIEGVRVPNFSVTRNKESGAVELTGNYELVSSNGIVLAKQSINGYGDIKLTPSPATQKLMLDTLTAITADLNLTLGLG